MEYVCLFLYHRSVQDKTDETIITRFKNGDNQAFEEIILKYQDKIFNLCCICSRTRTMPKTLPRKFF